MNNKELTLKQIANNIADLYEDMERNPHTPVLLKGKYITSKPYMVKSATNVIAKDIMNAVYEELDQRQKEKEKAKLTSIQLNLQYLIEGHTKVISKESKEYLKNIVIPNIKKEVK